jgi:translation elongation factor EF-1beta
LSIFTIQSSDKDVNIDNLIKNIKNEIFKYKVNDKNNNNNNVL